MKKKLLFSLALLVGAFMAFAQKPVNVADKYLENHTYPFTYVNKFTAEGDTVVDNDPNDAMMPTNTKKVTVGGADYDFYRFRKLAGPWVVENMVNEAGNLTGWHVDLNKGHEQTIKGALTLTNGWDGFASKINDVKVAQTTKEVIPAGKYEFSVDWALDKTGAQWAFFVVTKGTSLPDTAALVAGDPDVLGYTRLSEGTNVTLELAQAQNVTIGLVASFSEPSDGGTGYCVAMGSFAIKTFLEGLTNYTEIKSLVSSAEELSQEQYPIGTTAGTYPQEKWDAFVAARDAAKAIVDAENTDDPTAPGFVDTNTQEEVDPALNNLQSAIENLNKSFILPFKLSTTGNEIWYVVHDRRAPNWYWSIDESELDGVYVPRLLNTVKENVDESLAQFQFKFTENPDGNGYLVYNKEYMDTPLSVNQSTANFIQIVAGKASAWLVKAPVGNHPNHYRVYEATDETKQLNTYRETQGGIIGFWNATGEDPGNDFYFQRVYLPSEINMSKLKQEYGKVLVVSEDNFPVGDAAGEFPQDKWDAFVDAKNAAKSIIDTEDTPQAPKEQAEVDAAADALTAAFDALVSSMNPPVKFSTDTEEHWYTVKDKREYGYYWKYDTANLKLAIQADSTVTDPLHEDALQFKFVKPATAVGNEFFIYSKVASNHAITYYIDGGVAFIFEGYDAASDTTLFVAAKTPAADANHFIVYVNGDKTKQLNSNRGTVAVDFWNPGSADDPGNDWTFIAVDGSGVENVGAVDLGIYVSNDMIKSRDNAEIRVFNISGQRMDALRPLESGVYVVTVKGKQGATKVIIE